MSELVGAFGEYPRAQSHPNSRIMVHLLCQFFTLNVQDFVKTCLRDGINDRNASFTRVASSSPTFGSLSITFAKVKQLVKVPTLSISKVRSLTIQTIHQEKQQNRIKSQNFEHGFTHRQGNIRFQEALLRLKNTEESTLASSLSSLQSRHLLLSSLILPPSLPRPI